jgi:glycosyltransferase involved in cell wall biosynthesis
MGWKRRLRAQAEKMHKPRVLISHPTGNQNVRNALASLVERGMLAEFWTTIAWDTQSRWNRLLPSGLRTLLGRRTYAEAPRELIKCVLAREMVRLGAKPALLNGLLTSGELPFSIIGVYRHFDGKVARRVRSLRPDVVYAYEGGARETFREAKRLGIPALYELPSSYWYWEHRFLSEEAERNPAFAGLLPKLQDSPGHMQWKDEELRLADFVFVASQHVRHTLYGVVPDEKIRVVSYGAPPIRPRAPMARDAHRPLRVLFVGALIQRKGISYLLDAVDRLGAEVELTVAGKRFRPNSRVDEALGRVRWFETLSHGQVLDLMMEMDVLVLPSLCEAFGLVVTEAMACGLPVIVTPNVGAADLVSEGREGFVVPICSSEAIAERLHALGRNHELLAAMSRNAQATAAEASWECYRSNFRETVEAIAACQ